MPLRELSAQGCALIDASPIELSGGEGSASSAERRGDRHFQIAERGRQGLSAFGKAALLENSRTMPRHAPFVIPWFEIGDCPVLKCVRLPFAERNAIPLTGFARSDYGTVIDDGSTDNY